MMDLASRPCGKLPVGSFMGRRMRCERKRLEVDQQMYVAHPHGPEDGWESNEEKNIHYSTTIGGAW